MAVHLRGVEVCFDSDDECFLVTLPARLGPILGRQGRLRCRLDAVRRADRSVAISCADRFESEFDVTRRLVLPRELANRRGVSIDSKVDVTLEARVRMTRWVFWRRAQVEAIAPHEDETIDLAGDDARNVDPAQSDRASAMQPADLDALRRRAASDMAAIQAAIDAPVKDQELRRIRMAMAQADHPAAEVPASSTERRRRQEILALYRTVRDSRLAGPSDAAWPGEIASNQMGPALRLRRSVG